MEARKSHQATSSALTYKGQVDFLPASVTSALDSKGFLLLCSTWPEARFSLPAFEWRPEALLSAAGLPGDLQKPEII